MNINTEDWKQDKGLKKAIGGNGMLQPRLSSDFTFRTMQRLEAELQARERRQYRIYIIMTVVMMLLGVGISAGLALWMFPNKEFTWPTWPLFNGLKLSPFSIQLSIIVAVLLLADALMRLYWKRKREV